MRTYTGEKTYQYNACGKAFGFPVILDIYNPILGRRLLNVTDVGKLSLKSQFLLNI